MTETNASPTDAIRCPTCGARQSLSLECRRCKCDLSLVSAAWRQSEELAQQCCRLLRDARFSEAELVARRLAELNSQSDANRYLAVCHLMLGRFQAALDLVEQEGANRK